LILKGQFVTLRNLIPDDAAITQKWRTSGRAFLLNKGAQTVEEQRAWIHSRPFDPARELNFAMVLSPQPSLMATGAIVPEELRREPRPVGMISLVDIDLVHRRAEPAHFLIGESDAVKGIPVALEAVKLLYELAFDRLGLHRLYGPMSDDNKGMLRFHLSLGMKEEGRQRDHYFLNGHWQDAILIGMLEDEYRTFTKPKIEALIRSMSRGPRSHS
jgi:RimJ/RimL family protein N-acetyltransferase